MADDGNNYCVVIPFEDKESAEETLKEFPYKGKFLKLTDAEYEKLEHF